MSIVLGGRRSRAARAWAAWAAVAFLACVAASVVAIGLSLWRDVDRQNAALAERLEALARRRPDLRGLEHRLEALKSSRSTDLGFVPGADPIEAAQSLASDVRQVVEGAGASVDILRTLPSEDNGPVTLLQVEVSGGAASPQLAPVLAAVEARTTLTTIESLRVTRTEPNRVTFRVVLRSLWAARP